MRSEGVNDFASVYFRRPLLSAIDISTYSAWRGCYSVIRVLSSKGKLMEALAY